MSNYDWQVLHGYDFSVGAEVVNGTGEVRIRVGDTFAGVPAEKALDLARLIVQQAHEAMRAEFVSNHVVTG